MISQRLGRNGNVAIFWKNQMLGFSKLQKAHLQTTPKLQELPSRDELVKSLKSEKQFDVLVIGGGSAGAGVALDAQTRGLKTALVEYGDYCCGTSSKSSKLLHGGVKYLETALKEFDLEQYKIVQQGLNERINVMKAAPFLSKTFPVLVPTYKWWQSIYYWGGVKVYDFLAGKGILKPSKFISKEEAIDMCPSIRREGLRGAILYYDGQQNDARLVLVVALTAIRYGAKCVNYTECVDILKDTDGKVNGALVKDHISGETYKINSKVVVNATGPFNDHIRKLADEKREPLILGSSGIHLTVSKSFCPGNTALVNPKSSDGRVIFAFPWEGVLIVGTTDDPSLPSHSPSATEKGIDYILHEMNKSFEMNCQVKRSDVESIWCGIRGLVLDPSKKDHKTLARNHLVYVDSSGLITIAGGKLTTFRLMAEETMDKVVEVNANLEANRCITRGMKYEGGHGYTEMLPRLVSQKYGIEEAVAEHLCKTYGVKVYEVIKLCKSTGKEFPAIGIRLHQNFPFLEAEVRYAVREYAQTPADILARRTRMSLLDVTAAREVLPRVIEIMAEELGWSSEIQKKQFEETVEFLNVEMGLNKLGSIEDSQYDFNCIERTEIAKKFFELDKDNQGYFTSDNLAKFIAETNPNHKIFPDLVNDILLEANDGKSKITVSDLEKIYLRLKNGSWKGRRLVDYIGDVKNCKPIH